VGKAEAAALARSARLRSSSRTSFTLRTEGSPRRAFNLTWQGRRAASCARARCVSKIQIELPNAPRHDLHSDMQV